MNFQQICDEFGKAMDSARTGAMQGPTEAARAMRHRPGFAWLDSSLPGPDSVSILACEPDAVLSGRDWGALENELRRRKRGGFDLGFPDGAAIGWVDFDGWFHFGFYDKLHVYNHAREAWVGAVPEFFDEAPPGPVEPLRFETLMGKSGFVEMVRRAKEYIAAGDIYQVCLSRAFEADGAGDAWGFYEALRHYSPAPQSAFLDAGGLQIASASPECFLKMSGRRIATRPIKGTRPRHADPQRDLLSAHELMTSPKEIAELVMITDMERNDLGRVSEGRAERRRNPRRRRVARRVAREALEQLLEFDIRTAGPLEGRPFGVRPGIGPRALGCR